jgi:hypothetical protein
MIDDMSAPVSKSEFARLAGVSAPMIAKLTRPGGHLVPAMVGRRLDRLHPAAVAYLESRGRDPAAEVPRPPRAATKRAPTAVIADHGAMELIPEDIRAMADRSLRDLVGEYGTDSAFVDWLKAVKEIEMIHERRLRNAEAEGVLVSREIVADYIIDPIDVAHRRLMTDGARTLGAELWALAEGGGASEEDFIAAIAEYIGSFVRALKPKLLRGLRAAGA